MFQFIETPLFTRISGLYLDDDEYAKLQRELNDTHQPASWYQVLEASEK